MSEVVKVLRRAKDYWIALLVLVLTFSFIVGFQLGSMRQVEPGTIWCYDSERSIDCYDEKGRLIQHSDKVEWEIATALAEERGG